MFVCSAHSVDSAHRVMYAVLSHCADLVLLIRFIRFILLISCCVRSFCWSHETRITRVIVSTYLISLTHLGHNTQPVSSSLGWRDAVSGRKWCWSVWLVHRFCFHVCFVSVDMSCLPVCVVSLVLSVCLVMSCDVCLNLLSVCLSIFCISVCLCVSRCRSQTLSDPSPCCIELERRRNAIVVHFNQLDSADKKEKIDMGEIQRERARAHSNECDSLVCYEMNTIRLVTRCDGNESDSFAQSYRWDVRRMREQIESSWESVMRRNERKSQGAEMPAAKRRGCDLIFHNRSSIVALWFQESRFCPMRRPRCGILSCLSELSHNKGFPDLSSHPASFFFQFCSPLSLCSHSFSYLILLSFCSLLFSFHSSTVILPSSFVLLSFSLSSHSVSLHAHSTSSFPLKSSHFCALFYRCHLPLLPCIELTSTREILMLNAKTIQHRSLLLLEGLLFPLFDRPVLHLASSLVGVIILCVCSALILHSFCCRSAVLLFSFCFYSPHSVHSHSPPYLFSFSCHSALFIFAVIALILSDPLCSQSHHHSQLFSFLLCDRSSFCSHSALILLSFLPSMFASVLFSVWFWWMFDWLSWKVNEWGGRSFCWLMAERILFRVLWNVQHIIDTRIWCVDRDALASSASHSRIRSLRSHSVLILLLLCCIIPFIKILQPCTRSSPVLFVLNLQLTILLQQLIKTARAET